MSDYDNNNTNDNTDNLSTPAQDRITAAIAYVDFAADLYDLAANHKAYKARLTKLRRLEKEIAAVERSLAAARTQAAELVAKAEADVQTIRREASERLDAAATAEDELAEREQKIARLEAAWRFIGEPETVLRGFQSPEFSPLQKARLAHGQPAGKDHQLLFSEPDAAPGHSIDAYIRRDVGDERSDAQGNAFAPSTLTRSTGHKRGAQ
jgi:hypothetical protein